jgi:lipopolysaccharide transport system permease protein
MSVSTVKPTYVVRSDQFLSSRPSELWKYRELFLLLVKRDFVASYKQTVLGPLWFFVQPFLSSLVFVVIFSRIAGLSTTDLPPLVYYMSGIIAWNFFANSLTMVSYTFLSNGFLFRKIYFPRLIMSLSQITNQLLSFCAQFLVLLVVIALYNLSGHRVELTTRIWELPFILGGMAMLALGLGSLISAATVKYRDLSMVVVSSVQLWMFGSLVIYPRESVPQNLRWLLELNPMASCIEWYRSSIFGSEQAQFGPAILAAGMIIVIFVAGLWSFAKAEGTFTDLV